jgi:LmbE family N-acetylglucosaminyl deacetylase
VISLSLPHNGDRPLSVLCLGAHADDIEIGCGGTLLRLLAERPETIVRWIIFSGNEARRTEAKNSARTFLGERTEYQLEIFDIRDGYFPFYGAAIKDVFEDLKRTIEPSLIFSHWIGDAHQDHRVIAELTRCTFRNHLILEYEIPKYDGDLGNPNVFVPLLREQMTRKVNFILANFPSQAARQWFDEATFIALARLRGVGCNAAEGVAEAFHSAKLTI